MYIVTGGAGMIGSATIWALNTIGIEDILVVDNLASSEKWKNLVCLRYTDYMHRDEFLKKIQNDEIKNVQGIVHMGACSSTTEKNAEFLMQNNFHYTQEVFHFAKRNNIRFVNASSAATYGGGELGFSNDLDITKKLRPLNMYGYSKQLFDLWCIRNNYLNDVVNLKFFNVYGPNEYHKGDMRSVACKAVEAINERGFLQLFCSDKPQYSHGGQKRDFIYVKDCAKLIVWFLQNSISGIFNVGTGTARTWNSLANAVFAAMDRPAKVKYIPMPEQLRGKYQYFTEADMSWLEQKNCPIQFTDLETGVKEYVQDYLLTDNPYLSTL